MLPRALLALLAAPLAPGLVILAGCSADDRAADSPRADGGTAPDIASGGGTPGSPGSPGGNGTGAQGGSGSSNTGGTAAEEEDPAGGCPKTCGTHKWACWPMPNVPSSDLPNPASYEAADGVVHDGVTCLDWQETPPDVTFSQDDAIAYCEDLSLGGRDDWRLPTRVEWASIIDVTRGPALDPAFTPRGGFHKTGSNWVLTIDQQGAGSGTDFAWAYNLSDGIVSNAKSGGDADSVRCVRGNGVGESFDEHASPPPNHYTVLSDDEARDNHTGLVWQRDGDTSGPLSWQEAVTYCADLELGGSTSWRLPSLRELATLVDENAVAPSIDEVVFPDTHYGSRSNNWYWAAERARNHETAAWALNFDDGFTGFNSGAEGAWNHFTAGYAKCVR